MSPIGRRVQVVGGTNAGKSTLGARLADCLGVPAVDLDALNWLPGWVALTDTDPARFEARVRAATAGDGWVVCGNYSRFTRPILWPRVETMVWLDMPLRLRVGRVLARSWSRWRSKELLWGTNRERFWGQLKVWSEDSLLWWAVTQHARHRRQMLQVAWDPQWRHIRFVRLVSAAEVDAFARSVEIASTQGDDLPNTDSDWG